MASEAQDIGLVLDDAGPGETPAPAPPVAVQPARLPTLTKVLFGIGSMADGSQIQIIGGLLLLYYSQILHMRTPMVSLAIGMSLFIDAFWDLIIAQFSDNLRTPLGRRHLLMYLSALPAGLSFMCLWMPPAHMAPGQLFVWLFTFILLFRFSHSLYMVPSGALLPELAPGYHDRTVLFSYRYLFGTIGGVIAGGMAYFIFLRKAPGFPLGQLNPAGYPPMGIAVGVLIIVSSLISSVGTHSRIDGLYRPPKARLNIRRVLGEIGSVLNNHNFIVAVVAGMFAATAAALNQGLTIYFNTYLFHLPASNVGGLLLTALVSAPIAFLLAPALGRRWGKRRAFMTLYLSALVFLHGPIVLRLLGLLPANGSPMLLPTLLVSNLLGGLLATSGAILNTSMIADIIEENQAKTGRRSEGVVLFCDRLLLKVASSMAAILPGILLAVVRFPETAHPNKIDPNIVRNLALIYLPLSVGAAMLAMLTLFLFRIDRDAHARNLAAIAARKAAQSAGEA